MEPHADRKATYLSLKKAAMETHNTSLWGKKIHRFNTNGNSGIDLQALVGMSKSQSGKHVCCGVWLASQGAALVSLPWIMHPLICHLFLKGGSTQGHHPALFTEQKPPGLGEVQLSCHGCALTSLADGWVTQKEMQRRTLRAHGFFLVGRDVFWQSLKVWNFLAVATHPKTRLAMNQADL